MAKDIRAAKRYATALFEVARRSDKLPAVRGDISDLIKLMQSTPKLVEMWESPLVPSGKKRTLLKDIFGNQVDPITLSFLLLLVDKRREVVLDAVNYELGQLTDANNHLIRAEATFAVTPTDAELESLKTSLQQRTGESIELTTHVDSAILGGIIVRMQDTIIDGSVRGRLERLRETLLQES